jgi:hypothetical protein
MDLNSLKIEKEKSMPAYQNGKSQEENLEHMYGILSEKCTKNLIQSTERKMKTRVMKSFLLDLFQLSESNTEKLIASELLILHHPKHCTLAIYQVAQHSKNEEIKHLSNVINAQKKRRKTLTLT